MKTLVVGIGSGVLVSWLTRPVHADKLTRFFILVRTPVLQGEEFKAPCQLPDNDSPAPDRKLFPNTNIELQRPTTISILGFIGCWFFVAGIIYVFHLIAAG